MEGPLFYDVELLCPRARELVFVCVPYPMGDDEYANHARRAYNAPHEFVNVLRLDLPDLVQRRFFALFDMYGAANWLEG